MFQYVHIYIKMLHLSYMNFLICLKESETNKMLLYAQMSFISLQLQNTPDA